MNMYEAGVIVGNMEMIQKEEYIQKDIYELKKALFVKDYIQATKLMSSIEMQSSDGELLSELNRLRNILY